VLRDLDLDCDTCIWFDICDHYRICGHYSPMEEPEPAEHVTGLTREEARMYWNIMYSIREE
jgi:hypothetical protein